MKLYILSCGRLYNEKAFFWHFGPNEDSGKEYVPERVCFASLQYYIDHPEAKILFDTGWKLEEFGNWKGFPQRRGSDGYGVKQEPDENPIAQLRQIGVKIDDIDYVVISHLMCDHAGWLPAFAGKKAQIVVQRQEYDYANRVGIPIIPGYTPPLEQFHTWMYFRQHYNDPELNFKLLDGDYELVKDVVILSAPGHTPGYQVILVRLPKTGTVVLSPCEHLGMYYAVPILGNAPGIPHTFTWFAGQELQTFKMLREIVDREKGHVFCGHDWDQFMTLKHVPECYK